LNQTPIAIELSPALMVGHKATVEIVQRAGIIRIGLAGLLVLAEVEVVKRVTILDDRQD